MFYRLFVVLHTASGVDSLDWKNYGVDSILTTVLNHKHLGNGSIILCHNGAKYTAKALPQLIDGLKEKGFDFVKMSELIYSKDYEMDTEGRQHKINASDKKSKNLLLCCYNLLQF